MCIILLAYRAHPVYRLILAANRDEFYARPTARAAFWDDAPQVLAGRDMERGGTWLGVTRSGKVAAVTNYREPSATKKAAPSRGQLVSDFLLSEESTASDYMTRVAATSNEYNGFNLFAGDVRQLYYHSNRANGIRVLAPGVYGLSNHLLDTPWPKVERGTAALSKLIYQASPVEPEAVFSILADGAQAVDALLPQTGVGLEIERVLSPLFISTRIYGTRSSTLLLVEQNGKTTFVERTYEPETKQASDAVFQFQSDEDVVSCV